MGHTEDQQTIPASPEAEAMAQEQVEDLERDSMAEKEINEVEYTIPFRALLKTPRTKRAPKAIKLIREYVAKHQKADMENIWIDQEVNEFIWARGIEKPPNKITLRVAWIEDDDLIEVLLPEE